MTANRPTISVTRARELLDYDPTTGIFRWRVRVSKRIDAGTIAGSFHKVSGYTQIQIEGRVYRANRLAWLVTYGSWPAGEVDHKDNNRQNDRLSNLRCATKAQNQHNRGATKRNKLGLKGVYKKDNTYTAEINFNGRRKNLGRFKTPEEAHQAYTNAAKLYHGEFARAA